MVLKDFLDFLKKLKNKKQVYNFKFAHFRRHLPNFSHESEKCALEWMKTDEKKEFLFCFISFGREMKNDVKFHNILVPSSSQIKQFFQFTVFNLMNDEIHKKNKKINPIFPGKKRICENNIEKRIFFSIKKKRYETTEINLVNIISLLSLIN